MYGITVNTSIPVVVGDPNADGKFGLLYPGPGKLYSSFSEAEKVFDMVVEARRALQDDFTASLVRFGSDAKKKLCVAPICEISFIAHYQA